MNPRMTVLLVLLLSLFATTSVFADVENFKLADGSTVKCDVMHVTRDSITVRRWLGGTGIEKREDTFTWAQIGEEDRVRLMAKFGVPTDQPTLDNFFIRPGVKVTMSESAGSQVFEGYPMESESSELTWVVYTIDGQRRRIPRDKIEKVENAKVDIRTCLDPNSLYELYVSENFPISAKDHYKLAVFCEKIGARRAAIEHYRKSMMSDERLALLIGKERLVELEAEYNENYAWGLFEQAQKAMERKNFKEAANFIARIVENYPGTRAEIEARKLESEIKEQLNMVLAKDIVNEYYNMIDTMLRKRVTGKVLDGASKPGFRVTTSKGSVEGELTDINGKPVPPPSTDELDYESEDYDAGEPNIYIKDHRNVVFEIPKHTIKKMEPVELNKNLKKPIFSQDHLRFVSGKDSELNREIRAALSFKYGLSEREIKEMWDLRAVPLQTIDRKTIRPSLAKKMTIAYGRGTYFSPRAKRTVKFQDRVGLVPRFPMPGVSDDDYFDALSPTEKKTVLLGIFAEYSMEVLEESTRVNECTTCKGTGKDPNDKPEDPRAGGVGCKVCHGLGAHLSIVVR